jgi:hypothetical protein
VLVVSQGGRTVADLVFEPSDVVEKLRPPGEAMRFSHLEQRTSQITGLIQRQRVAVGGGGLIVAVSAGGRIVTCLSTRRNGPEHRRHVGDNRNPGQHTTLHSLALPNTTE